MKVRERFTGNLIADDDYEEPIPVRWCPECHGRLGCKILVGNEPKPADYDQWLQCVDCGRIFPIYEGQIESDLNTEVKGTDNPFDKGKSIVGLGNLEKPKTKQTDLSRKIKEIKKRAAKEKDPDIKREILSGKEVNVIQDDYMSED